MLITKKVLKIFRNNLQISSDDFEGGGQLFASINEKEIIIEVASIPDQKDIKSRFSFHPNRKNQNKQIKYFFNKGLHYVGDWHTHPEITPSPSIIDISSMKDCFIKSIHQLNYFILIIVGSSTDPLSIYVSLVNKNNVFQLEALA